MRSGIKFGDATLIDTLQKDGLIDAFSDDPMGITAENIAKQYGITREEQDTFAAGSQNKAEAAQKAGLFAKEVVPVTIQSRKGMCDRPGNVTCQSFKSIISTHIHGGQSSNS